MSNINCLSTDTLNRVWRWGTDVYSYAAISGITQSLPAVVTATAHGVPNGWRVAFENVKGMTQINASAFPPSEPTSVNPTATDDYYQATVIDPNTLSINKINSTGFYPYAGGGTVVFHTPVPLTGYTAKFKLYDPTTNVLIVDLSSDMTVDAVNMLFTLNIPAATVAGWVWTKANFAVEAVDSLGNITTIDTGLLTVSPP